MTSNQQQDNAAVNSNSTSNTQDAGFRANNNNNSNYRGTRGGGQHRGGGGGGGRGRGNNQDGDQQQEGGYRGGRGGGRGRGHYNNQNGDNGDQQQEGGYRGGRGGGRGRGQYNNQDADNSAATEGDRPFRPRGRGGNNYDSNNNGGGGGGGGQPRGGGRGGGYRGGNNNRGGFNNNNAAGGDDDDYNEYSRPPREFINKTQQNEGGNTTSSSNNNNYTQRSHNNSRPPRTASEEREVESLFATRHRQTGEGINFDRYAEIPVEISPKDIEGVTNFASLDLHPDLAANVARCGYTNPTPVQKHGIPVTFAKKDIMACAQTGSGKTAAFLLPIVNYILKTGISLARGRLSLPHAIVLAPTRELALQIFDEARKFAFKSEVRPCVVYGGVDFNLQATQLLTGCDLIIATPGRLKDMLDRKRVNFDRVRFLVLDEADRMLDLGFEDEIRYLVEGMPDCDIRQTMLYSATFPKPIQILARQFLKPDFYLLKVGRVGSTTKNIVQRINAVSSKEKTNSLFRIVNASSQSDLILVFVATKAMAEDLRYALNQEDIPCTSIHGDRKQWEREEALARFKSGECPIMIATDVASRGLDIPNVSHVIQYDLPNTLEDYVHRIGRTGRAGNQGLATAFFSDNNRGLAPELFNYMKEHEQEVPEFLEEACTERFMEKRATMTGGRGRGRGNRGGGDGGGQQRDGNRSWGDRGGNGKQKDDGEDFFNSGPRGGRGGGGRGGGSKGAASSVAFDDGGF